MSSGFIAEPEWFNWATGKRPTTLEVWDGTPTLFLVPTRHGAIMWWQFDSGEDGSQYVFLAHLTEAEAQKVFETKAGSPLSEVRQTLYDNRVVIARRHPPTGFESVHMFALPRTMSDDQFFEWLDGIGETLASEPLPTPSRGGLATWEIKFNHPPTKASVPHEPSHLDRLAATVVPA